MPVSELWLDGDMREDCLTAFDKSIQIDPITNAKQGNTAYQMQGRLLELTDGSRVYAKILDHDKINSRYDGDYVDLWSRYALGLQPYLDTSPPHGIVNDADHLVSYLPYNPECFDDQADRIDWHTYVRALEASAGNISRYVEDAPRHLDGHFEFGAEASVWNFDLQGRLFDFDPPRVMDADGTASTFSNLGDNEHIDRTIYRSFLPEGVILNFLVTSIYRLREHKNIGVDAPNGAVRYLGDLCLGQFSNDMQELVQIALETVTRDNAGFSKHPAVSYGNIIQDEAEIAADVLRYKRDGALLDDSMLIFDTAEIPFLQSRQ